MTKQNALAEIYNLGKPVEKNEAQQPTLHYTKEQQVLVLGLLRFKILTPEHFKERFEERNSDSDKALLSGASYFEDTERKVPFAGSDVDTNPKMA